MLLGLPKVPHFPYISPMTYRNQKQGPKRVDDCYKHPNPLQGQAWVSKARAPCDLSSYLTLRSLWSRTPCSLKASQILVVRRHNSHAYCRPRVLLNATSGATGEVCEVESRLVQGLPCEQVSSSVTRK